MSPKRSILYLLILASSAQNVEGACRTGQQVTANGMSFVRICKGAFKRVSIYTDPSDSFYEPPHDVTVSEFWIGKYEVTNEQFRRFRTGHDGRADLPAVAVSWSEAKAFCESLSGNLPTEAQWEYAARAGTQTLWSFGDDKKKLGEYAWYGEGFSGNPHPVGQKKANPWGLHDMHGNVNEWVADWYGSFSGDPLIDPTGPTVGTMRVYRGGSFELGVSGSQSAYRSSYRPEIREKSLGFRCARRSIP